MVSWPARNSVTSSSRTSRSLRPAPSSSWAASKPVEQVVVLAQTVVAPLSDHAKDDAIQAGDGALEAPASRRREPRGQQIRSRDGILQGRHRLGHVLGFPPRVVAEQRPAHDVQRQPHHLLTHVHHRAGAPALGESFRRLGHRRAVRHQPRVLERGLNHAAMSAPGVSVAGQQAAAQHQREALQRVVLLGEGRGAFDQHAVGVIRMAQHVQAVGVAGHVVHVAVAVEPFGDDADAIGQEAVAGPQLGEGAALRSRRDAARRLGL